MNKMLDRYLIKASPVTLKRPDDITFSMLKFQPATDLEIKEIGTDSIPEGYIAGWASTPDLDSYRHVVQTGAFDESIKARGLSGPKSVKLLLGHDWDKVTGIIKVLETRNTKLWIEAQLNLNISYAKDAYEAMKMTGGFNFSVGFMLQDYQFKEDNDKREYLLIERGDLFEVSIVPFPGNEEATMELVKSREKKEQEELEKAATAAWKMGASRNLPISMRDSWDGDAARRRMLNAAGIDEDSPRFAQARRGFLAYDSANQELRGSYKLPFADIINGRLTAVAGGLRAAASRLPQTHIPESVMKSARSVLDGYFAKMEKAAAAGSELYIDEDTEVEEEEEQSLDSPKTIAEFEKALMASGLVSCRNDAKRITQAVKCSPHLFRGEEEQPVPPPEILPTAPVLATAQLEELNTLVAKMRGLLAPVATS